MEKINRIWNVRLSKVLLAISLVGLFPFVAQAQGIEVVLFAQLVNIPREKLLRKPRKFPESPL